MKVNKGRLSLQQKQLIRYISEGRPVAEAARMAGYPSSSTRSHIYEMMQRPAFKSALATLMDSQGLDDSRLLEVLKGGLEATRSNAKGEEIPDHPTRLKSLELALKIRGSFSPEKSLKATVDLGQILRMAQHED